MATSSASLAGVPPLDLLERCFHTAPVSAYVLTTPCFNELEGLPALLASIEGQDQVPSKWLVVDDSSDDGSREWLEEAAASRPWMEVRQSPESADEYLGNHIARIKRWGLEQVIASARSEGLEPAAAGVLDADVRLPVDHYSRLVQLLEADPKLGVVSSIIRIPTEGGYRIEKFQREDLPRGPTQFFRLACLEDMGGLPPYQGFDGAANVKARLRGWGCRLVTDLVAEQVRETASRYGLRAGYERRGRYAWFLGHHPLLVLAKAVAYSLRPPFTIGSWFLFAWLRAALSGTPRCPDDDVRGYYGRERLLEYCRTLVGRGPTFIDPDKL